MTKLKDQDESLIGVGNDKNQANTSGVRFERGAGDEDEARSKCTVERF